jgi:hypothetical protein
VLLALLWDAIVADCRCYQMSNREQCTVVKRQKSLWIGHITRYLPAQKFDPDEIDRFRKPIFQGFQKSKTLI